jgi:hypothetical protein
MFIFYYFVRTKNTFIDFKFNIFKNVVVCISFVVLYLFFYIYNPGGALMGYMSIFIYIVVIMTSIYFALNCALLYYSSRYAKADVATPDTDDFVDLMKNQGAVSKLIVYSSLLVSYVGVIVGSYYLGTYAYNGLNNTAYHVGTVFSMFILVAAVLGGLYYFRAKLPFVFVFKFLNSTVSKIFLASSLLVFVITVLALAYAKIQNTDKSQLALNIVFILFVSSFVYRAFTYSYFYRSSPLFQFITDSIFYIPCLVVALLDNIVKFVLRFDAPSVTDYTLLVGVVVLNIVYFGYPSVASTIAVQGGKLLQNDPVSLDVQLNLGTDTQLNSSSNTDPTPPSFSSVSTAPTYKRVDDHIRNYHHAISFWFYVNATQVRGSADGGTFVTILNYGQTNVSYSGYNNALRVKAATSDDGTKNPVVKTVYKNKEFMLQKWNHMILNYDSGTLDVFLNGQLVASANQQNLKQDSSELVVGANRGLNGQICNINYFNQTLNVDQIYNLYNFVKDYNLSATAPPIVKDAKTAVLQTVS